MVLPNAKILVLIAEACHGVLGLLPEVRVITVIALAAEGCAITEGSIVNIVHTVHACSLRGGGKHGILPLTEPIIEIILVMAFHDHDPDNGNDEAVNRIPDGKPAAD